MTDLGTVLPHYRNIIIQVSCAVIGYLILTSTFYHGLCIVNLVGLIRELKAGAERIKEGNLDNDVVDQQWWRRDQGIVQMHLMR